MGLAPEDRVRASLWSISKESWRRLVCALWTSDLVCLEGGWPDSLSVGAVKLKGICPNKPKYAWGWAVFHRLRVVVLWKLDPHLTRYESWSIATCMVIVSDICVVQNGRRSCETHARTYLPIAGRRTTKHVVGIWQHL